jgi:DNA-binding transcriptional regulator LsrR (DeoR family)
METKEINAFRDSKPHQKEDWLRTAYITQGKEVGDIAKELNISVKLVHTLLKEFNIVL